MTHTKQTSGNQNQQKINRHIALFLITLIITMPLYAAQSVALSLQINKNSGEAGVPAFIDGKGDTWTVEAKISGASSSVDAKDLSLTIGTNKALFQSCAAIADAQICKYISPLSNGVPEAEHSFQVTYQSDKDVLASDTSSIKIDGTAPKVSGLTAVQDGNNLVIDFTADDKVTTAPAVGIKRIEIIDADDNKVLHTVDNIGKQTYRFSVDGPGKISAGLSGAGLRHLKVRAEDLLGHSAMSSPIAFLTDFEKPEIKEKSLEFVNFGKYISDLTAPATIKVDIVEKAKPLVTAISEKAKLEGKEAVCTDDPTLAHLWHCSWTNIDVTGTETIALTITAKDQYGNMETKTLTQSFTKDNTSPQVLFLGTPQQYNGKSFIHSGENIILLKVEDSGSGITADGIRANLQAFGGSKDALPTCEKDGTALLCQWKVTTKVSAENVLRLGLSKLKDNVGNSASLPEIELFGDVIAPKINSIEFSAEDRPYFQSNDKLKIALIIEEINGLSVLVNLKDLVLDAATKYPQTPLTSEAGWAVFTEESCTRKEGAWHCLFETNPLRSGPDVASLEIKVLDSAGNAAMWNADAQNKKSGAKGTYQLEILGVANEPNPDYWQSFSVTPLIEFIDLDTTALTRTRMPLAVRFNSPNKQARLVRADVLGCSADVPSSTPSNPAKTNTSSALPSSPSTSSLPSVSKIEISRVLLAGKNFPGGQNSPALTNLIVEIAPFDGKKLIDKKGNFEKTEIPLTCRFQLFSKIGKTALSSAEVQDVHVLIPFAFSTLGAQDENIDAKIADIKNSLGYQIPDKLKYVNDVIKIVRYITPIIYTIMSLQTIYNFFTASADTWRYDLPPYTTSLATAQCVGTQTGPKKTAWGAFEKFQVVLQVFTCNPDAAPQTWYKDYQKSVLNAVNTYKNLNTRDATTLYDNIYISVAGLCLPGIVHNLEKYRQIQCVHIDCLKNKVPAGVSTIAGCQKIDDILTCKYFYGELIGTAIPFIGVFEVVKDTIKNAATNPLGLVRASLVYGCALTCPASGEATTTCDYIGIGVLAVDIVSNLYGAFESYPSISQDYCSEIDEGGFLG